LQFFLLGKGLAQLRFGIFDLRIGVFKLAFGAVQSALNGIQGVVDTDKIASGILAEIDAVCHLPFKCQHIILAEVFKRQGHLKSPVTTNRDSLKAFGLLHGIQQGGTGVLLVRQHIAADGHAGKAVLRVRMFCQRLQVGLKSGNIALAAFYLLREGLEKIVFQPVLLTLVVGFHQLQPGNVDVQVHLFLDALVAGAKGLDLRIGESRFVNILAGSHRRFARHDLRNEFLLVFQCLPEIGIEGSLRHIAVDMHLRIHIALPDDTPAALLQIS